MHTIQLSFDLTDEFLADVATTAIEGGINYWTSRVQRIDVDTFALTDEETDEGYLVTHQMLANAIERILGLDPTGTTGIDSIASAVFERDAGAIDAIDADCIVQVAVFGEVLYG